MDLFEIITARTRQGAIVFCSQLDPQVWYERIGTVDDGPVSETIIDRVKHSVFENLTDGNESMRE